MEHAEVRYGIASYLPGHPEYGFRWPASGQVERSQIVIGMPQPELLRLYPLATDPPPPIHIQNTAFWVVVEIPVQQYREVERHIDFASGNVVCNKFWPEVCEFLRERGLPIPRHNCGPIVIGTDCEKVHVGDYGYAIAAHWGEANAGDWGLAALFMGKATVGKQGVAVNSCGQATCGDRGVAYVRCSGDATAGSRGVAITDEFSQATAGDEGVALSTLWGVSTVGARGVAVTRGGTVRAGPGGVLVAIHRDPHSGESKCIVGVVGSNGIEADKPYHVDESGNLVPGLAHKTGQSAEDDA